MNDNMTTLDPKALLDQFRDDHAGLVAALEAALPKPTYPERMMGRWAKHSKYGDVLVGYDRPDGNGEVFVSWPHGNTASGTDCVLVSVSELTFPEQATKPEDVPIREAWLVNVDDGKCSGERVVALKFKDGSWYTGYGVVDGKSWWPDEDVTLIAPLVAPGPQQPERKFVETEDEYAALPAGSIVAKPGAHPWTLLRNGQFEMEDGWAGATEMAGVRREVLREGRGDE